MAPGITGAAWLVTRLPGFRLGAGVGRPDIAGIALLGGVGFTVSLLVGELPSVVAAPATTSSRSAC